MKCSWAACDRNAVAFEAGWPMCRPHLLEHRRFEAEDARRIAVPARLPSRNGRIAACGTRSGFNRHKRLDEQPCDRCTAMEQEYQRLRQQRRKAS